MYYYKKGILHSRSYLSCGTLSIHTGHLFYFLFQMYKLTTASVVCLEDLEFFFCLVQHARIKCCSLRARRMKPVLDVYDFFISCVHIRFLCAISYRDVYIDNKNSSKMLRKYLLSALRNLLNSYFFLLHPCEEFI